MTSHLRDLYRSHHWGIEADRVFDVDDPDLPDELCVMGRLLEVEVNVGRGRPVTLNFDRFAASDRNLALLAFTAPRPRRLFAVLTGKAQAEMLHHARHCYTDRAAMPLVELARAAGGLQASSKARRVCPYPDVDVVNLGTVAALVYSTAKKDDAKPKKRNPRSARDYRPDGYHHTMGEDGGVRPYLGLDADGRIWFAGGDYTVPEAGITN